MVADFNVQKRDVDMKKVSKSVQDAVDNIKAFGGKKKKIDTEQEFFALSNLLAGNSGLNRAEIDYVEGFMIDYQNEKAKQFEKDCVTDNTKDEVKKIQKRMGNKKQIDSDEEAQALVTMLRNSKGDLNQADILYIQNLLIKSGYAHYLQQSAPNQVNVTVIVENPVEIEKTTELNNTDKKEEKTVEKSEKQWDKPVKPRRKKGGDINPTPSAPPKNETEKNEYKVSEAQEHKVLVLQTKLKKNFTILGQTTTQ